MVTTTAPAIIRYSCSTNSAIWNVTRFVPPTCTTRRLHGCEDALRPVIIRYRGRVWRICSPNQVLLNGIAYLLKRPVGAPPNEAPLLRELLLPGGKLEQAAPGGRQDRVASRVGFIVTT